MASALEFADIANDTTLQQLGLGDPAQTYATYSAVVPLYISFSMVSILLAAAINWIYWSSKRLQADHASTLISTITTVDAAYTFKFFVGAVAWSAGLRDERSSFHLFPDNCRFSAAYGQFTGMACVGWNAVWMYDLVVSLSNPLVNTASLRRWYHGAVWTLAVATTIAVVASPLHETAEDHTCRPQASTPAGLLFVLPLFGTIALGLVSLAYAFVRLSGGRRNRNAEISTIRRSLRNRHAVYVAAFILLWAWPILHDYVDPNDQIVSLTVMDAVAVSGQAAVFAAIRLSEPGAAAMFAALVRRLYRGLCVYPFARFCGGGQRREDAKQELARDKAALVAALERTENEFDASPRSGGSAVFRPTLPPLTRSHSGTFSGWFKRAAGTSRLGRANSEDGLLDWHAAGLGTVLPSPGSLGRASKGGSAPDSPSSQDDGARRARAVAMLGSAMRRPSVDEEGGEDVEGRAGSSISIGSSGRVVLELGTAVPPYRAPLALGDGEKVWGSAMGAAKPSFFGFFGKLAAGVNSDNNDVSGESKGASLLSNQYHHGGPEGGMSPISSTVSPSAPRAPPSSAAGVGRETSFAVAEAQALGSGWDVASAAGLRMELGATMLAALVEAVRSGDARARGGKEASVFGLGTNVSNGKARRKRTESTNSGGSTERSVGGGVNDSFGGLPDKDWVRTRSIYSSPQLGGLSGAGAVDRLGSSRGSVPGSGEEEEEEDDFYDEPGHMMSTPLAPDLRRSLQTWARDATSVHLPVTVRHPLQLDAAVQAAVAGVKGSSSGSGSSVRDGEQDDEEEEEEVEVTSFADADFAYLRRAAAVSPGEVARGFDPSLLRSGALRAHFSDGASSSFFCRSLDGALVLKTLLPGEVEILLRLLPAFARHLADNPDSLLVRFYGCFSVTLAGTAGWRQGRRGRPGAVGGAGVGLGGDGARVYFTLMSNVFPVSVTLTDSFAAGRMTVFDLKGSTINRRARPVKEDIRPLNAGQKQGQGDAGGAGSVNAGTGGDRGRAGAKSTQSEPTSVPGKPSLSLDLDLRDTFPRGLPLVDAKSLLDDPYGALRTGCDVLAGRSRADGVMDQLRRDVTLLASQGLMDYSLLVQVIPVSTEPPSDPAVGGNGANKGGGGSGLDSAGVVLRVTASSEISLDQAGQLLHSAANPPKRSAPAPLLSSSAPDSAGPRLLLPVLTKPGSTSAQGISISRWSNLAVSMAGVGGGGAPETGSGAMAGGASPTASAYPARAIVQLGIVDVLQFFDTTKKLENALKNLRYGSLTGEADVSAVDPHRYAVRFTDFLSRVFSPSA